MQKAPYILSGCTAPLPSVSEVVCCCILKARGMPMHGKFGIGLIYAELRAEGCGSRIKLPLYCAVLLKQWSHPGREEAVTGMFAARQPKR
jgi:hypothetical protein